MPDLENVIQQSTDYGQFNMITANRDIIRSHVENIKKSIEANGNYTRFSPVLVNERMEIIDGQHRFTALKEMGLPIYYIVTRGSGVREAREMNKLNKGWTMLDWAKTYANTGARSYQNFLVLVEEYPMVAPSILLQYAEGSYPKGLYATFREGNFILSDQGVRKTRERVEMLLSAVDVVPEMKWGGMAAAFLRAMNVEGYNHKRMLAKLREYPEVKRYESAPDCLRQLEDVYNYHYAVQNRVRFF